MSEDLGNNERPTSIAKPKFHASEPKKLGRYIVLGVILVAVVLVGWKSLRAKPVTTSSAVKGTAIDAVYAIATVEALDRVTVKAKVPGSILDLKVREGDTVKKGDLLATIDSPSLKFQLERGRADQWAASQQTSASSPQVAVVEAQARMTEASLNSARDELARVTKLVSSGAMTSVELDRVTSSVAVLEAQLASQRAQARALRIDLTAKSSGSNAAVSELAAKLADTEVRAPIDGVVLARLVEAGELVTQNGILFRIGDLRTLVFECAVDEADIGRLSEGKKAAVSLYAFPGQTFHGEIFEILPDADRTKKSFLVKVRASDAPKGLRSGMSAEVNIIVDEHPNVILAPTEAVDVNNTVWVVQNGKLEKRTVRVGVRDMIRVEILSGLAEGEQVVISSTDGLKPGARVAPTFQAQSKSAVAPKASAGGGSL